MHTMRRLLLFFHSLSVPEWVFRDALQSALDRAYGNSYTPKSATLPRPISDDPNSF